LRCNSEPKPGADAASPVLMRCICATATCLAPLPLPRAPMCVAAACARVLAVRLCLPRAHSVPHGQVMVTKDKAQKGKVRAGCPAVPPAARSPGAA
jgi:hypothetical protein